MITGKHVSRLSGYAPALPTPFDQDGNVNSAALEALCERQIQEGATALVVCGTTGEAPTLTRAEHYAIICIAVGVAQGRVPVIAGAGSNSSGQAIELARDADAAGADAVLSVVPYYNKPTRAGMYAHFHAIADAIGLPIILHDVPSRTVCGLADDTVAHLAECPKFIGLKDATGDVKRPLRLRSRLGPEFRLLSGDDATALAFIGQGGNGCISVTSNVAPGLCRHVSGVKAGPTVSSAPSGHGRGEVEQRMVCGKQSGPRQIRAELDEVDVAGGSACPLVELKNESKAEIDAVLAQVCDGYADYMIGNAAGQGTPVRSFIRVQPKRNFAVSV
jgi:4-hydroxy-tetrahydrodipicolinate synthase